MFAGVVWSATCFLWLTVNELNVLRDPAPQATSIIAERPLCVDLDGTLLRTDTLWEACLALVRSGSLVWLLIPFWLLRGKAYLKQRVAALSGLDVATLPWHSELLVELERQHAAGRAIFLCTGTDLKLAEGVAEHLGLFTGVLASNGETNLTGSSKRRALIARFGEGGFDYIGNSRADLPVWQSSRTAHVVDPSPRLLRLISRRAKTAIVHSHPRTRGLASLWLRALRIHQWTKNLLVLAPMALSHHFAPWQGLAAFLAFGLAASSSYLINDLLDLQADRKHAYKRKRPFASGDLPLAAALVAVPSLWLLSACACLFLPLPFGGVLVAYFIASLGYSIWLKRIAPLDIIVLSMLYTVRITAGGVAAHIAISPWTLAASTFLFLSLAIIKRVSELREFREGDTVRVPGRSYVPADLQQLSSLGGSAGYMSVLVTALYINSSDVQKLYSHPQWLWLVLPIQLYWVSRLWLYANRGWIHQDPIVFALRDRTTYVAAVFAAAIALIAI